VVFELIVTKLREVILAKDHVLDQLGYLLVELDYVWFLVHEVLDLLPVFEERIVVGTLSATSETVDDLAEDLTG